MKRLVYLSPISWHSFAQRPHKFVEWFYEQTSGDVLWIDPYPTRLPSLSDLRRLHSAAMPPDCTSLPPWLTVTRPQAIPIEPLPGSALINRMLWRSILREIEQFSSNEPYIVGIGKPSLLALTILDSSHAIRSVYDAMDDFPAFYNSISRSTMEATERKLVGRVSHMMVSSTALKHRWERVRPDVQLIHNGLDHRLLPTPFFHRKGAQRTFGYIGTIADWFDWQWVISLAKLRADDLIRLIGPVFTSPPESLPRNIETLPPLPHHDALRAMQDFDVGLIPFRETPLTESVDPIKFYEYRALGLPIISTDFGEMRHRKSEPGVHISTGLQDLGTCAERALQHYQGASETQAFIDRHNWKSRFCSTTLLSQ